MFVCILFTLLCQFPETVRGFSAPAGPTATASRKSVPSLLTKTLPKTAANTTNAMEANIALSSSSNVNFTTAVSSFGRNTLQPLIVFVSFSLIFALGIVAWEDYGAKNLWPSRRMIVESTRLSSIISASTGVGQKSTTASAGASASAETVTPQFGARTVRGLAFGKTERLNIQQLQQDELFSSSLLPEIRSYNEVSKEHRIQRVGRWQTTSGKDIDGDNTEQTVHNAVQDLRQILLHILELKTLASDYQWDKIHEMIQSSILPKLEPAATVIRLQSKTDKIGYEEVGFDWGSCAWRHCGALADAQEALDELDHLLGLLEPPECLFCLDVAERSVRAMLAVVPSSYNAMDNIPAYAPYQSTHSQDGNELGDEETSLLDKDYLRMLQELRKSDDSYDSTNSNEIHDR